MLWIFSWISLFCHAHFQLCILFLFNTLLFLYLILLAVDITCLSAVLIFLYITVIFFIDINFSTKRICKGDVISHAFRFYIKWPLRANLHKYF